MKKLTPIMFALCLLFTACGKESQKPVLEYDYTGRVYSMTTEGVDRPLCSVYEFYSTDSVSFTTRWDSWDGEMVADVVSKRGYKFEYRQETPVLVVEWTTMFGTQSNSKTYVILDDNHFREYASDDVFTRVR